MTKQEEKAVRETAIKECIGVCVRLYNTGIPYKSRSGVVLPGGRTADAEDCAKEIYKLIKRKRVKK